ncbi:MAG: hypothetical protein KAT62_07565 [Desulfuromonadales bacterium]|nr:hypothetical protein [Desulfuromonadales bacterium]
MGISSERLRSPGMVDKHQVPANPASNIQSLATVQTARLSGVAGAVPLQGESVFAQQVRNA